MGMYQRLETKIMALTPEFLKWFASLPKYVGDRDITTLKGRRRIAWLRHLLNDGRFHPPEWAIVEFDGITYRVNGSHSSAALLEAFNEGKLPPMNFHLRPYKANSHTDMALLFSEFDQMRSVRDGKDNLNAHIGAEEILLNASVSTESVRHMTSGIGFYFKTWMQLKGIRGFKIDQDIKSGFVHSYADFISIFHIITKQQRIASLGPMAAMFATWLDNPQKAYQFWTEVEKDNNPSPRAMTRLLSRWLLDGSWKRGQTSKSVAYAKFKMCAGAYQKWLKGIEEDFLHSPIKMPDFIVKQDVVGRELMSEMAQAAQILKKRKEEEEEEDLD